MNGYQGIPSYLLTASTCVETDSYTRTTSSDMDDDSLDYRNTAVPTTLCYSWLGGRATA